MRSGLGRVGGSLVVLLSKGLTVMVDEDNGMMMSGYIQGGSIMGLGGVHGCAGYDCDNVGYRLR